ncbi:DegV family protein [Lacticaseibacillus hulanensis]|uniref:DegV family protein n=1 Tax=Lacticaseibacillus hulanensis TaxID=2493111 RepID=UPI000FDAE2FE|nr:DegV family protein [Lacticaseibacillus hulanensis]
MKIAVITDSTAYLMPDQIAGLPIRIVTTPIILDDQTYNEGVDITPEEFWAKLKTAKSFPHTSQPRLGDVLSTFDELKAKGYDTVLCVFLSATISGINSTISAAAQQIKDQNIVVYDSQITVAMMGEMVLVAGRMAKAGASLEEITAELDVLRASTGEYFMVNDLQHLVRGGRLSSTAGFVGGMLRIKPLLTFNEEHRIVVAEKVRTAARAYARIEELFTAAVKDKDYPIKAWVIDSGAQQEADLWQAKLQKDFPKISFTRTFLGPAITTHIGPGALALAWMLDSQKYK